MAYIGRLAGAILVQTGTQHYLVGDCKEPIDFEAAGFMPVDPHRKVLEQPYVAIEALRPFAFKDPWMSSRLEGEALPQKLVDSFLIFRNGSVSERLWRLALLQSRKESDGSHDVNWLTMMPSGIWDMVRDQILRC